MSVKSAIEFRKNIRVYDNKTKISSENLDLIIEAGRMAPSSYGLEPVKIIVVSDDELKDKLAEACFMPLNVSKVKSASTAVLILAADGKYATSREFVSLRKSRHSKGQDLENAINGLNVFNEYIERTNTDTFGDEQAHIVGAYMGLQAADLKIGSTIMTGVMPTKAAEFIKANNLTDMKNYHVIIGMAFGYYDENTEGTSFPRLRISKEEFSKKY